MRTHLKRLRKGYFLLVSHLFLFVLAGAFIPTFFKSKRLDISFIILLFALTAVWAVVMFFLVSKFEMRTCLALGHVCHAGMFFSLAFLPAFVALIAYAILLGTTFIIFWIPLNLIFYRSSKRQTNVAVLIKVEKERIVAPFRACITQYKKLKTITFLDGAFHYLNAGIIPVYTLLFITTEKNFGWFLGYLGLIGFIIAIFLSYKSDKKQKRIGYIMFLFILMSFSTLSLVLAKTISVWIILVGIFTIIYNVSNPFRLAVTMDVKKVNLQF